MEEGVARVRERAYFVPARAFSRQLGSYCESYEHYLKHEWVRPARSWLATAASFSARRHDGYGSERSVHCRPARFTVWHIQEDFRRNPNCNPHPANP